MSKEIPQDIKKLLEQRIEDLLKEKKERGLMVAEAVINLRKLNELCQIEPLKTLLGYEDLPLYGSYFFHQEEGHAGIFSDKNRFLAKTSTTLDRDYEKVTEDYLKAKEENKLSCFNFVKPLAESTEEYAFKALRTAFRHISDRNLTKEQLDRKYEWPPKSL